MKPLPAVAYTYRTALPLIIILAVLSRRREIVVTMLIDWNTVQPENQCQN